MLYLWPHSKNPKKEAVFQRLRDDGWRFDSDTGEFFTPQGEPEAYGRLSTDADVSQWARITRPSVMVGGEPRLGDVIWEIDLT